MDGILEAKTIAAVIPLVTAFLAVIVKNKYVGYENGKSASIKEFLIYIIRFLIVYSTIYLSGYIFETSNFNYKKIIIDLIMLIVFLIILMCKEYNYQSRKSIAGIISGCIFLVISAIIIFNITFNKNHISNILISSFFKSVSYFIVSLWSISSSELDKKTSFFTKVKAFLYMIYELFKNRKVTTLEYYLFAILGLFIFLNMAEKNSLSISLFGLHEITRFKYFKGVAYIIIGSIILSVNHNYLRYICLNIYVLVAIIDLALFFYKNKKR
ncbi:hypothetical protein AB8L61_10075 [Clostridioides difficile]